MSFGSTYIATVFSEQEKFTRISEASDDLQKATAAFRDAEMAYASSVDEDERRKRGGAA
jgi:hypothetical protein